MTFRVWLAPMHSLANANCCESQSRRHRVWRAVWVLRRIPTGRGRFYLKLLYGPARLTSAMLNPRSSVQIRPFRTVMMVRPASVSAIVAAAPSATAGVTW